VSSFALISQYEPHSGQLEDAAMKRTMTISLLVIHLVVFLCFLPVQAIQFVDEETWFDLQPKGGISVGLDKKLSLSIKIVNKHFTSHTVKNLLVVVIDPFDGSRIMGPTTFPVDQTISAGGSHSLSIGLGPVTDPVHQNKTFAAMIAAIDPQDVVRGATGWGFVTK
jgi:hypothetical protein